MKYLLFMLIDGVLSLFGLVCLGLSLMLNKFIVVIPGAQFKAILSKLNLLLKYYYILFKWRGSHIPTHLDLNTHGKVLSKQFAVGIYHDIYEFSLGSCTSIAHFLIVVPYMGRSFPMVEELIDQLLAHGTVRVLCWKNPRDIDCQHGCFTLEKQVLAIIETINVVGDEVNIVTVSSSNLATISALAYSKEMLSKVRSLTTLGGGIRFGKHKLGVYSGILNKTYNFLFSARIPRLFAGCGVKVIPWLVLKATFIKSSTAFKKKFISRYNEGSSSYKDIIAYYDRHLVCMDLDMHLCLDLTMALKDRLLENEQLIINGKPITAKNIHGIKLLVIEASLDDITPPGTSKLLLDLCVNNQENHYALYEGIGHRQLWTGQLFRTKIADDIVRTLGYGH